VGQMPVKRKQKAESRKQERLVAGGIFHHE
jgi:hypothetical protein